MGERLLRAQRDSSTFRLKGVAMSKKLTVFVSHSFDMTKPPDGSLTDVEVAEWFIRLMRHNPLNFNTVTGAKPEPGPIPAKILQQIRDSDCLIGIFTKKYYDSGHSKWFPSQFVVCECGCAIGFFHDTSRLIAGFCEKGVDPKDLALVTMGGLQVIPFDRADLDGDKSRFLAYLKEIPARIQYGTGKGGELPLFKVAYTQERLHKIYTIYGDGRITVQNINRMVIRDAERFNKEYKGMIPHEIWHEGVELPPLDSMTATSVEERRVKPFLQGIFRLFHNRKLKVPLEFMLKSQTGGRLGILVRFLDEAGQPVAKFKNNDILEYQYAWGIPRACKTKAELADPGPGSEVREESYNRVGVVEAHGKIHEMVLELRFERGRGARFSKSPFAQHAVSARTSPAWSSPEELEPVEEEDHAMWFETYIIEKRDFTGQLRVLWRPRE